MTSDTLLKCVLSFQELIGTRYIIHLGRSGKHVSFEIKIEKEDCHHLMGIHYLTDRPDRRSREKIFDDIVSSEEYRNWLISSEMWTDELEDRVLCTALLSDLLDDNATIIRYNPKRLSFYSRIKAEYLFTHKDFVFTNISEVQKTDEQTADIYLFIDKKEDSDLRFCKSIFPKKNHDYTEYQAVWTLLYKEKIKPDGTDNILYCHNNYNPQELINP
ncbi:MAG: hypothetical protein K6E75_07315 [Lachnospiraceae bacterium]|nr:hypothetical protein [Lachnospiraceae bacterium]